MIRLGEKQVLKIVKIKDFGVYLGEDETSEDTILLPKKEVPAGAQRLDAVEVFIYRDSMDRLIATTAEPKITLGKIASLTVKDMTDIGAFMDWGLPKDLMLPFKEQTTKVRTGQSYLVALYIDKSNRLCATMRLYDYLSTEHSYEKDAEVEGTIYQINDELGSFVAVENRYHGMIPANYKVPVKIGDQIKANIVKIRDDGKIELNVRKKAYEQMDEDAMKLYELLESYEGVFPFTEKATPDVIYRETGLSKAAFKRAVGRLLKSGKIQIIDGRIRKC